MVRRHLLRLLGPLSPEQQGLTDMEKTLIALLALFVALIALVPWGTLLVLHWLLTSPALLLAGLVIYCLHMALRRDR